MQQPIDLVAQSFEGLQSAALVACVTGVASVLMGNFVAASAMTNTPLMFPN
jgi:hypothetical protein